MKNLKEIISQLDTVTPCVLNPLFLRHKSSGPFACIHPSGHQITKVIQFLHFSDKTY